MGFAINFHLTQQIITALWRLLFFLWIVVLSFQWNFEFHFLNLSLSHPPPLLLYFIQHLKIYMSHYWYNFLSFNFFLSSRSIPFHSVSLSFRFHSFSSSPGPHHWTIGGVFESTHDFHSLASLFCFPSLFGTLHQINNFSSFTQLFIQLGYSFPTLKSLQSHSFKVEIFSFLPPMPWFCVCAQMLP